MNYYDDLGAFPLSRWWKCIAGDYSYTRIDLNDGTDEKDWNAWCVLHDEYIRIFTLGKETERVNALRMEILMLQCDYVIHNENFLRNKIRRLQKELFDLVSAEQGLTDKDDVVVILEKWRGIEIKEDEISAKKYYKILKVFEEEQALLRAQQNKT